MKTTKGHAKGKTAMQVIPKRMGDFFRGSRTNKLIALCVVVAVLGGGYLLMRIGAASFFAVTDPESGTITGNAQVVNDASAAGGKAIEFRAPATTPPSQEPTPPSPGPQSCPAYPAFPDENCTGVPNGTSLTPSGGMTINTANTVIENKDIEGCVDVRAPGVIIRRSRIACAGPYVVYSGGYSGAALVIEDSEISCTTKEEMIDPETKEKIYYTARHPGTAVGDNNVSITRTDIHDCDNGFDIDVNFTIRDNYIHNLYNEGDDPHSDGIQHAIGRDVLIYHNTIYNYDSTPNINDEFRLGTSAIITNPTSMNNVTIEKNLLAGGAYTLYCPRDTSVNVRVFDNHISRKFSSKGGAFGPWSDCEKLPASQIGGNVWHETNQPLSF